MYQAYITRLKNVRKHPNADRLQVGECFGNQVIVSLDYTENQLGLYFPVDGKIGLEYAEHNSLLEKYNDEGKNVGGHLHSTKRNVKAIRLRGEKSEGLFMPLESLSPFTNIAELKEGTPIDILGGTIICEKYIPPVKHSSMGMPGVTAAKHKKYPLFVEHKDTQYLDTNLSEFKPGNIVEITLKLHGTSQRTSNTLTTIELPRTILHRIFKRPKKIDRLWEYVTGSRRVILGDFDGGGYYGTMEFRKKWHDFFLAKLAKGEEVFYEIVGMVSPNNFIMASASNKKTNDKDFIKQYGDTTYFTYGCDPELGEHTAYVYRMTMTNEDGYAVEYSYDQIRNRCNQMGINIVPLLDRFIYITQEDLLNRVAEHVDGPDPIGKTHIREGVVVRIASKPSFRAYKHKNFYFKMIEGIAKDSAETADMEEAQEVLETT